MGLANGGLPAVTQGGGVQALDGANAVELESLIKPFVPSLPG